MNCMMERFFDSDWLGNSFRDSIFNVLRSYHINHKNGKMDQTLANNFYSFFRYCFLVNYSILNTFSFAKAIFNFWEGYTSVNIAVCTTSLLKQWQY